MSAGHPVIWVFSSWLYLSISYLYIYFFFFGNTLEERRIVIVVVVYSSHFFYFFLSSIFILSYCLSPQFSPLTTCFLFNFFSQRSKWYSVIFGHGLIAYSSGVSYTPRPEYNLDNISNSLAARTEQRNSCSTHTYYWCVECKNGLVSKCCVHWPNTFFSLAIVVEFRGKNWRKTNVS